MARKLAAALQFFLRDHPCTRSWLASRAKMAAASSDVRPADHTAATRAFLSIALVHAMAQLECPFSPVGIHIIRNRRPAEPDRFQQDFLHGSMQPLQFRVR